MYCLGTAAKIRSLVDYVLRVAHIYLYIGSRGASCNETIFLSLHVPFTYHGTANRKLTFELELQL